MSQLLIPGYKLRAGSGIDRALLVKFLHQTYRCLAPEQDFSHLTNTVEQYFSNQTPLWWVDLVDLKAEPNPEFPFAASPAGHPVACLWLGNAIDQISGDRHAHIFLLYVAPAHRRRGIASALLTYAQNWAKARGDRQLGLQVFLNNPPALALYQKMGFCSVSLLMSKSL